MILRAFAVVALVFLCAGFTRADEFTATLVKVAENKITFTRGVGKKKQELTLPADPKCRVVVAKYDAKTRKIEAGDEVMGGLKNPLFEQLEKEPIEAWVRTSSDNMRVLELRIYRSSLKKKKS